VSAYNRLRRAVLAYADALKKYAQFGSAWMEEAPELDTLWADVLSAAEPEFEPEESHQS